MNSVYTIAVLDVRDEDSPEYWRTPAIFTTLEAAIRAVKDNELDIAENGTNKYAVVEKTQLNVVYPQSEERHWFEWDDTEEEYVPADIPFRYMNVYNFGIG